MERAAHKKTALFYKLRIMILGKVSLWTRIVAASSAIMLAVSVYVPIWRIELDAPQYPEGLALSIYANRIGGDVEIINGLNHYIGMATLHSENFWEFTALPYIIWGFAILFFVNALVGRKWLHYASLVLFALFGILAMVDFWHWEYEYGHNLDPNAAIKVPGMAYQPPLIGFKQLLNFGAYSIPDIGGWLFIVAGVMMLLSSVYEVGLLSKWIKPKVGVAMMLITAFTLTACVNDGPVPIKLNQTKCDFCQMTIADGRFAAQFATIKGRVYNFDDVSCLVRYEIQNPKMEVKNRYVSNFENSNELLKVEDSHFVSSEQIKSPMRGNVAAFNAEHTATAFAQKWNTEVITWTGVVNMMK